MKQIVSEVVYIPRSDNLSTKYIEDSLSSLYGEIIRWAVVEVLVDKLKICVSYMKP